jgi:hypothetical protein
MEVKNQHHATVALPPEKNPNTNEMACWNVPITMHNIHCSKNKNPEHRTCRCIYEIHKIKLNGQLSIEDQVLNQNG